MQMVQWYDGSCKHRTTFHPTELFAWFPACVLALHLVQISAFKDSLGLSDEDAAPVHIEVGRRLMREGFETKDRGAAFEKRKVNTAGAATTHAHDTHLHDKQASRHAGKQWCRGGGAGLPASANMSLRTRTIQVTHIPSCICFVVGCMLKDGTAWGWGHQPCIDYWPPLQAIPWQLCCARFYNIVKRYAAVDYGIGDPAHACQRAHSAAGCTALGSMRYTSCCTGACIASCHGCGWLLPLCLTQGSVSCSFYKYILQSPCCLQAFQRLIYVSQLVYGDQKTAFLLPWRRHFNLNDAQVGVHAGM